jgi:hypothetical protein
MTTLTLLLLEGTTEEDVRALNQRLFRVLDDACIQIEFREWKGVILYLETYIDGPSIIFGGESMRVAPTGSIAGAHRSTWSAFGTRVLAHRCFPIYEDAAIKNDGTQERQLIESRIARWLKVHDFLTTSHD